ncbi:zinc finger CCCH domain-containing protein 7 isoform X2 [Phalaenopsis equestris]|uniref:zinc finger CCCH domain-containing protein 7 isoform X2 n=1 Tax=Phalaenopsis equestris TaxID=78828 RepID=UPI0009E4CCBE|nr:zinc finger CCCH domain-containing protein 7 isoform X2 [Phalaenopsis equestris]
MESVLRRIGNDLETLYSPTGQCSSFSSYIPRRIHLDSSSHRSLVRILSCCVNNSLFSLSTEPGRTLSVKNPFSIQVRGQLHQVQEAGGTSDGRTSAESQEGDHNADCGVQGASVDGDMLFGLDLSDCDEKEIEARVNSEELHSIMFECGRLIDAPNEEHSAESREGSGQTVPVDIAHNQLEIAEALVNGADERVSHLGEVLEVARVDRRVYDFLNDAETTRNVAVDVGNQISSEEGTGYDRAILVETQDENFKGAEEEEGEDEKQQPGVCSTPIVVYSGLKNFKYDQLRNLDHPIDGAEVEEGEISDEVQDLEELVDINDKVPDGQRKEGDDFSNIASTSSCIHKIEVPEFGASPLDRSEENLIVKATQMKRKVVEAKEKKNKKNSTLTEERKAKKKIAKKRKRAQKNREQGVKKLKLHAIVKPKEVKYCNFYRMGRCQQGDLCKFSHDLIPLTKSMPCKYFVSNSCLRGDDCPYDHELSKYPCLNYLSSGSCNRGDRCKFSHKLTDSKIDSLLTLEQQKFKNQLVNSHASPLGIGPFESKTIETVPLRNKPLTDANRVPKGIRFISFGTVQTDLTNKVEKNLPVNKSCHTGAYNNHQKQDDLLARQHKSALNLLWNSLPPENSVMSGGLVAHVSSNDFAVKDSGNATKGSPAAHPGGTANDKVSEAAKILDEFLFCGAD